MSNTIDRDAVRHLAGLARLELTPDEEARLERDLGNILAHFTTLQEVKTDKHTVDVRGEALTNIFREDESAENTNRNKGTDAFPDAENNFLKIPPVFE